MTKLALSKQFLVLCTCLDRVLATDSNRSYRIRFVDFRNLNHATTYPATAVISPAISSIITSWDKELRLTSLALRTSSTSWLPSISASYPHLVLVKFTTLAFYPNKYKLILILIPYSHWEPFSPCHLYYNNNRYSNVRNWLPCFT